MIEFGAYNCFPHDLGGGDSKWEQLHMSLLDQFAPGWDVDENTGDKYVDAYMMALAISIVWDANQRLSQQSQPLEMMEWLTTWEQACGLRPSASDSDLARRRRVAAKLRVFAGNQYDAIVASLKALLGDMLIKVRLRAPVDTITYWPGVEPGPPGFEWYSGRSTLLIQLDFNAPDAVNKIGLMDQLLESCSPAWMTWDLFATSGGFTLGTDLLGTGAF